MVRVRYSFGSRHTGRIENIKKQRGKYPQVMKDVIAISDIVLEILDARYIHEMRNDEIENDLIKGDKKLIYVLNKCDLVDEKKVKIPKDMRPFVFVSATNGKGAASLRGKIKIMAKKILREKNEFALRVNRQKGKISGDSGLRNKRVHVGIIGFPNAGKSSVINLIARKGVTGTSVQAGYTKGMQKIRMSEGILILDTPGVIPESRYSSDARFRMSEDAKVGARSFNDVKNPEEVVTYLMRFL